MIKDCFGTVSLVGPVGPKGDMGPRGDLFDIERSMLLDSFGNNILSPLKILRFGARDCRAGKELGNASPRVF